MDKKISELTELLAALDADLLPIVDAAAGETKKIKKKNLLTGFLFKTDFLSPSTWMNPPFLGALISGGTITADGESFDNPLDHPGSVILSCSPSVIDSGARFKSDVKSFYIGGAEQFEIIFLPGTGYTEHTSRMGFDDSIIRTAPTNGIWLNLTGLTLTGKTASGGSVSTTGTSAGVSVGVAYRAKIIVSEDAARVDFYLYNSDTGELLWSDYLTTNIPYFAATGGGIVATWSTPIGAAQAMIIVDYMEVSINRVLSR